MFFLNVNDIVTLSQFCILNSPLSIENYALTFCLAYSLQRKCWEYWYETKGKFGNYEIELKREQLYADFVVRELKCSKVMYCFNEVALFSLFIPEGMIFSFGLK